VEISNFFDMSDDRFLFSGDLLQHFLTVIFNKLDRGETWDDDFELNTILQVKLLDAIEYFFLISQKDFIKKRRRPKST
jgi:hypothetical protein